jgi:predicted DNA-binding transcriptional regulator YafY
MSQNKAEFKAEGLDALRLYLLAQPTGRSLRQADIARHFGKDRATIGRWLATLESQDVPIRWDEHKRVSIDRQRYFVHLSLSRHESIVLMLALRLYQQRQDKSDRHVVEMLQKLGVSLRQGVAPKAGEHVLAIAHQQRLELDDLPHDHQRVLEAVSNAWIDGRKVQMRYRPLRARRAFDDVFHPYILEPSVLSRTTYVIGYSELVKALRVRKLERIERLPLVLDEPFSVVPDFDPFKLLGSAWSIWFDEGSQPVHLKLRFSDEAIIRRVREERWHPSQQTERDAEGRLIWQAQIDEPQEMLPWIRGWGAACEVLEPAELREQLIGEIRRQMRVYGIEAQQSNSDQPDLGLLGSIFGR